MGSSQDPANMMASFSVAIKPGRIGHAAPPAPEFLSKKIPTSETQAGLRRVGWKEGSFPNCVLLLCSWSAPSGNASPTHRIGYLPFWDNPAPYGAPFAGETRDDP
ncbi:hypothetical protein BDQ94DRAFT_30189 [Aspergillus welwitschiae]|uniref:Uncharacterized protein n=1 Tax=Aspergillus welwitschiae TaxID=1341132 RepID=A0A3F3Q2P5_9EURO|nr:hypothetical protein BDQ94DRAFT_30189 [Aspergillus welwitschiae]RDH33494.1 hypothetical protein BDQ94DRAFT_30189 [Aspergillus welwitschiae]